MKVLWLSHFVPYPPKGGCFQRSYNLIARVGARHEIHLIALRHKSSIHPDDETRETRQELLKHCKSVYIIDIFRTWHRLGLPLMALLGLFTGKPFSVAVYRSSIVRTYIRTLRQAVLPDVVHFDTIGLAQYLDEVKELPAVMTHHGAESHMIWRRIPNEPSFLKKAFYVYEWLALRAYERRMCPRFFSNVVMSEDDGVLLAGAAPEARFTPVENGVDTSYFMPGPLATGRRLVFAGRLDQYANRHGILQFMEEAWPALAARYPDISIDIIGSNPPQKLIRMASAQVRVHGFVPDVRPFFRDAAVAVCPLWDGGGTRLKVLDALAQGTPLVATNIACEGLAVVHERDALLADSAADLVSAVSRLLDDAALRQRLSISGRALVERVYSWQCIAPKLSDIYHRAICSAKGGPIGLDSRQAS
jgi:glycosyltransferase involved in cell wall biosynthesis